MVLLLSMKVRKGESGIEFDVSNETVTMQLSFVLTPVRLFCGSDGCEEAPGRMATDGDMTDVDAAVRGAFCCCLL